MATNQIEFIPLDQLRLDIENPRLPLFFSKECRSQEAIINKFLADDSLIELMLAIRTEGFFIGESLLVVPSGDFYVVVEGNRRLSSLKLLNDPEIAKRHKKKISAVLAEPGEVVDQVPCIVFDSHEEIVKYLGYRHVTGIKPWSVNAKARYLSSLLPTLSTNILSEQARELAKRIGSRSNHVKDLLISYQIYLEIEDEGFFDIPDLNESSLHFNYIKDSLSRDHIRKFIGVNTDSENPLENLDKNNLKELFTWFFEKIENGKTLIIGDSKSLTTLSKVLSKPAALDYFRETGNLNDSLKFVEQTNDTFHQALADSLEMLRHAQTYMHNIDTHFVSDTDLLSEIASLSKAMRLSIIVKLDAED